MVAESAHREIPQHHVGNLQNSVTKFGEIPCFPLKGHKKADTVTDTIVSITVSVMAESVRFELTVGRPITSFQDWLHKPLGQLSRYRKTALRRFLWRSERDLNPRAAFDRLLP